MRGKLLALLITIPLLVACVRGNEETPQPTSRPVPTLESGQVTITFACLDYQQSRFQDLAEDFEQANPDIRVQIVSAEEALGTVQEGDTIEIPGNPMESLTAAADTLIWWGRLHPEDWAFLLDLGPFVDDPSFPADDFFPGTLDHFRWRGRIYGLPAEVLPLLVFYDREMFEEAGLPYPRIGWTWEELIAAAVQLTEHEGGQVTRYGFVDGYAAATVPAMLQQHGVPLWDERKDPAQPSFDTPEVAAILRRYTDIALREQAMPVPQFGSNAMASSLVNEGRAAMWTGYSFDREYHAERISLGLAPFPEGMIPSNPRNLYGFFISAGTAYPQASWRWLSYLSASYEPPWSDKLPGRRSVAERLPWWTQLDEKTRAIYEYVLAHPATYDDPLSSGPLLRALSAVFEEGAGVEEGLAEAQEEALNLQGELAESRPATPRPVASAAPGPREGQRAITFAPILSTEVSFYRELAVRFQEAHPDIYVQVEPVSSFDPEELFRANDCLEWIGALAGYGPEVRRHLRTLGPLVDADADFDLADYYPQSLEPLQQEGELWGLPRQADALMVYLNLNRFAEAGVSTPQPGWTFVDFLDAAASVSDGEHYGFTTREGAYGDLVLALERMGARLFDDSRDPPAPAFDDPMVATALEQYAASWRGGALSPQTSSAESGWPDSIVVGGHPAGVEAGQAAMWVDSIWNHSVARPLSFEVGAAPLPILSIAEGSAGAAASTEFEMWAYYISAYTSEPQACWEWLAFLSEQPETVSLLPPRRSLAASSAWRERAGDSLLPAYLATLDYEHDDIFYLRRKVPWLAYAYPWLYEAFRAVVAGEAAARALTRAQAWAEDLLACLEAAGTFTDHAQLLACARQVDPDYPAVYGGR